MPPTPPAGILGCSVRRTEPSRVAMSISRIARAKEPLRINGPIAYIILYVALYAAFGVASPFWPKFFETKALSSQQIGLILGAALAIRPAAGPIVGMLADFFGIAAPYARFLCYPCSRDGRRIVAGKELFWLFFIALAQAAALAPTTSTTLCQSTQQGLFGRASPLGTAGYGARHPRLSCWAPSSSDS